MSLTPSETFKQLVLAFPRPRKPSNNLFRPFRALENLQTTCFGLSDASETFKQLVSAFPTPRGVRDACQVCRVRGQLRRGVRDGPCRSWGRAFLRSDRNKCTSSSCFCLRILVRLRGQRSIRKTCVSIRNITYFISPVHMAGMFILQAPYLLPISAVCFPRCSRNPRAANNPSRRN